MNTIELVFRSVGERTSDLALSLALKHIAPDRLHVVKDVAPFSRAVVEMLKLDLRCDSVVFLDADCLILEDMRPFLLSNRRPFVDCYVWDKFRGRVHCGVHVTRLDVVREMQALEPPLHERRFVLKPESYLRKLALANLRLGKEFESFRILHDFAQYHRDIFHKYAIRQLRSRSPLSSASLELNMRDWARDDLDFVVAEEAVRFTRERLGDEQRPEVLREFIGELPSLALGELERLGIREKAPLTASETDKLVDSKAIFEKFKKPGPKIFGLGLSRTGTKSLTVALHKLGYNVIHYPDDATTLVELEAGRCDFSVLYRFDGITDITVAPYYAQLDQLHPGSKFILTTREKNAWLASMARHYKDKHTFFDASDNQVQMQIRRFLRAAVYGCLSFEERRMGYVFDQHLRNVREYFLDRPQDLLSLDITAGDGWEKLCPFLGKPIPGEPFPSVRKNVRNCLAPVPEGLAASQTTLRRQ